MAADRINQINALDPSRVERTLALRGEIPSAILLLVAQKPATAF